MVARYVSELLYQRFEISKTPKTKIAYQLEFRFLYPQAYAGSSPLFCTGSYSRDFERVTVTDDREIVVSLPSDFPPGEAHVIVHSAVAAPKRSPAELVQWLDDWIASFPKAPHLPDSAFDRDSIYRRADRFRRARSSRACPGDPHGAQCPP